MVRRRWFKVALIVVGVSAVAYVGYRVLFPSYFYDGSLGPRPSREEVIALVEECRLTDNNWRLPSDFSRRDAMAVCELALRLASGDPQGARVYKVAVYEDLKLGHTIASVSVVFTRPAPGFRDGKTYGVRKRGLTWRVESAGNFHFER